MSDDTLTPTLAPPADPAAVELAALRAKRAVFNAAREEKLAKPPAQQLAEEQRAFRDAEALATAQDTQGAANVALVESDAGGVVVKKPSKMHHQWFSDQGNLKSTTLEKYVRWNLVYPDSAAFDAILEAQPQILLDCANACARLAGLKADAGK